MSNIYNRLSRKDQQRIDDAITDLDFVLNRFEMLRDGILDENDDLDFNFQLGIAPILKTNIHFCKFCGIPFIRDGKTRKYCSYHTNPSNRKVNREREDYDV